jgi:DNA (cytosine-5)-methyltransferase 1
MRALDLFAGAGLIVDNFAGGGGASTGIEAALGRSVSIAIDHSPAALAMHAANHPGTQHRCESVWAVDPIEACAGRPVDLAWFSPDCTHFSRAKGAAPKCSKRRALASVVIRWARTVRPRVVVLENVEEFLTWGPLDEHGQPDPRKAGRSFRCWLGKLRAQGYTVEWRVLCAADFGAPTTRRRLFLVARCDGEAIRWPTPTHGKGRTPWRTAAEIIDWSIPCPSIFGRKKPLAEATQKRIAEGLRRYVLNTKPFLRGDVAAFVTKHYGGVYGQQAELPLGTITGRDHHALTTATLAKTLGKHDVRGWLIKYYGGSGRPESQQQSLLEPLHTVTGTARFGLVMVSGEPYEIVDIGMRMLAPHELFAAQGFPGDYRLDCDLGGKPLTKTQQIELCGNSVAPPVAEAIVRANCTERQRLRAVG